MTITLLFFLILLSSCHSSSLPAHLKCADKACQENVSVGRILQSTNLLFGDPKELKKSTKVNIKGKNVDINNSLWLVEFDGLRGFVDFSLIKENSNSIVHDLEISKNPYYKHPTQDIVEDTKRKYEDSDSKLFSKRDVIPETNSILKSNLGDIKENPILESNKNAVNLNEDNNVGNLDEIHEINNKNFDTSNKKNIKHTVLTIQEQMHKDNALNNNMFNNVNNQPLNLNKKPSKDMTSSIEVPMDIPHNKAEENNEVVREKPEEIHKSGSNSEQQNKNLEDETEKKESLSNISPKIKINNDNFNGKVTGHEKSENQENETEKMEFKNNISMPVEHDKDISNIKEREKIENQDNETEKVESINNISSPLDVNILNVVNTSNIIEEFKRMENQNNKNEKVESVNNILPSKNMDKDILNLMGQEKTNITTEKIELLNNMSLPEKVVQDEMTIEQIEVKKTDFFDNDIQKENHKDENDIGKINNKMSIQQTVSKTKETLSNIAPQTAANNNVANFNKEINGKESQEPVTGKKDVLPEHMVVDYQKINKLENDPSESVENERISSSPRTEDRNDNLVTNEQLDVSGSHTSFVKPVPVTDFPHTIENIVKQKSEDKNTNIGSDSVNPPTVYDKDKSNVDATTFEFKSDNDKIADDISLTVDHNKDLVNVKEDHNPIKAATNNPTTGNSKNDMENNADHLKENNNTIELPTDTSSDSFRRDLRDSSGDTSVKMDNAQMLTPEMKSSGVIESENFASKDSDPWLSISGDSSLDSIGTRSLRSPILISILKIEGCLLSTVQSIIHRLGLRSSIFVTKFVHNWLGMSLENFVLILAFLLTLVIVVYTPKMFRLNRDWKYEFEKRRQLVVELESKLKTTEEVHQKLTFQNYSFEKKVEEYKGQVTEIQENSNKNKKILLADLEKMKNNNENKIKKLSQDLGIKMKQFQILEEDIISKEVIINELHESLKNMELQFKEELSSKEDDIKSLRNQLSEVEPLKEQFVNITTENTDLKEEIINLTVSLRDKNDELNKLNSTFEGLRFFEGLDEEECREKVQRCMEYNGIRIQLDAVEIEKEKLQQGLVEANAKIIDLETRNGEWGRLVEQCKEKQGDATKELEAAEMKLQVLTDYFHKKEIEMQRSLGQESIEKSMCQERAESLRTKMENLETENRSLSKTVERLKTEVRQCQSFVSECKSEASSQVAQAMASIGHLERELTRERDECRQLRQRLSYYVGPVPAATNHSRERPPSRQSLAASDSIGSAVPPPPIFPLAMLPQSAVQRSPFSGRNSVNSLSKRSNHS